ASLGWFPPLDSIAVAARISSAFGAIIAIARMLMGRDRSRWMRDDTRNAKLHPREADLFVPEPHLLLLPRGSGRHRAAVGPLRVGRVLPKDTEALARRRTHLVARRPPSV